MITMSSTWTESMDSDSSDDTSMLTMNDLLENDDDNETGPEDSAQSAEVCIAPIISNDE